MFQLASSSNNGYRETCDTLENLIVHAYTRGIIHLQKVIASETVRVMLVEIGGTVHDLHENRAVRHGLVAGEGFTDHQ